MLLVCRRICTVSTTTCLDQEMNPGAAFPPAGKISRTELARQASSREAVQRAASDALYKLRVGEAAPRDWTTTNDAPV